MTFAEVAACRDGAGEPAQYLRRPTASEMQYSVSRSSRAADEAEEQNEEQLAAGRTPAHCAGTARAVPSFFRHFDCDRQHDRVDGRRLVFALSSACRLAFAGGVGLGMTVALPPALVAPVQGNRNMWRTGCAGNPPISSGNRSWPGFSSGIEQRLVEKGYTAARRRGDPA